MLIFINQSHHWSDHFTVLNKMKQQQQQLLQTHLPTFEKLKHSVELREKTYWERMTDVATGKLTTNSGSGLRSNSLQFVEVHLGCTIGKVVKAHFPAHVLARGVLTLLIYPRDSSLHKLFVEKNKGKMVQLLP